MIALALLTVVFVAFANGANDTFKGVATLYGSGTYSYRPALAWATATTLGGSLAAVFISEGLRARFSGRGLVGDAVVADPEFLMAVAVGAAGTVLLATRLGFPISTTHALTGGLVGAGLVLAGPRDVVYATLGRSFVLPLLLSPFLSLLLAAVACPALRGIRTRLGVSDETCVCLGAGPPLAGAVPGAGAVALPTSLAVTVGHVASCVRAGSGPVLGLDARTALDRLHALSAGAVGFARGLNDTPKIVALLVALEAGGVAGGTLLVGIAMAAGGLLGARRVARTLAFRITTMNADQALSANLVTAALVLLASPLGLPVSTTHVSCGALFGIGAASGQARWRTIGQILGAWVTTLPVAAALAAAAALACRALR